MRTIPQARCPNCDGCGVVAYDGLRDKVYGAPGRWRMRHCGNARCGAYWIDPAPHPEDLGAAYATYHTHEAGLGTATEATLAAATFDAFIERRLGIDRRSGWVPRQLSRLAPLAHQRSQSALYARFYLPWQRGGRLLEVGCGAGDQLATMVRDGWEARGVDFDPEAVAVAQRRGLEVSLGDVRDLELPLASFDAIVMAQVLEHVFDPVGLLRRCMQLLRPGGRLVSITPNADSLGHRLFRRDWRGLEPPRHLVVYTRRALRLACERAGLVADRIDVTARDAANLLLASDRIRNVGTEGLIRRPQADQRPPMRMRFLSVVERLATACGVSWGEELVLTAHR